MFVIFSVAMLLNKIFITNIILTFSTTFQRSITYLCIMFILTNKAIKYYIKLLLQSDILALQLFYNHNCNNNSKFSVNKEKDNSELCKNLFSLCPLMDF